MWIAMVIFKDDEGTKKWRKKNNDEQIKNINRTWTAREGGGAIIREELTKERQEKERWSHQQSQKRNLQLLTWA